MKMYTLLLLFPLSSIATGGISEVFPLGEYITFIKDTALMSNFVHLQKNGSQVNHEVLSNAIEAALYEYKPSIDPVTMGKYKEEVLNILLKKQRNR